MRTLVVTLCAALLAACGSSSSAGSSSGSSTSSSTTTSGSTGSSGSGSTGTGSSSGSSGTGSSSGTTGSSGSSGSTGTAAITGLPTEQWTWVDFPDAKCRDGSATGIGINYNPNSPGLVIFLNGGGACMEQFTCSQNPSHFDSTNFASLVSGGGSVGIFDRTNPDNPVADWSYVFVPYCTGDVHAGNNPAGTVNGVAQPQAFVGYANVAAYLQRLVPTFPSASKVMLAGASAGGFGALANYTQVARAFAPVRVTMVDDSGPMMRDPYLASCLQSQMRSLWGLESTLGADCGADCPDTTNYLLDYANHVARAYPSAAMGLIESTDDATITQFFGFGYQNCSGFQQESAADFDAGLMDLRSGLSGDANFGTYYFAGTQHTTLGNSMSTAYAGGVTLGAWVGELADGGASNVGP